MHYGLNARNGNRMRNGMVKAFLKSALLWLLVTVGVALTMLFPIGMLIWVVNPDGWKIALAGLPFLLAAIIYGKNKT